MIVGQRRYTLVRQRDDSEAREGEGGGGNSEVRERVTGFKVRKERWCELGE